MKAVLLVRWRCTTDKISRAIAAAAPLESGNVFVPGRSSPGTAAGYQAPGDDHVDAFSQAMNWARTHSYGNAAVSVPQGRIPEIDAGHSRLDSRSPFMTRRSICDQRRPRIDSDEALAAYLRLPLTRGYHFGG
jgi:hypothetical protein